MGFEVEFRYWVGRVVVEVLELFRGCIGGKLIIFFVVWGSGWI